MCGFAKLLALPAVLVASFAALGCAPNVASSSPTTTTPAANVAAVVEGGNQFAFDLYKQLAAGDDGNLFFSPQSISTALAMTYVGARGETAEQMARVLHFQLQGDELQLSEAALLRYLNALGEGGKVQLTVANQLWGQKGYEFRDAFLSVLRAQYAAPLELVDFADSDAARQKINEWVEDATAGKIKDLIPEGVLNNLTRLVLTNAIYFKGDWRHAFQKDATQPSDFHLSASETIQDVPLMRQKQSFKFGKVSLGDDKNLLLLELPYRGQRLSMVVLLPEAVDGLADLESQLSGDNLQKWLGEMRKTDVRVWLPKFKMTQEFQLKDALAAMGMKDAFSDTDADFSGMDGTRDLFLSSVIHKAFVDVNEQGTEAAAATGVVVELRSAAPTMTPTFRADHPFVFLLRDNTTGAILFMGRMVDPRK